MSALGDYKAGEARIRNQEVYRMHAKGCAADCSILSAESWRRSRVQVYAIPYTLYPISSTETIRDAVQAAHLGHELGGQESQVQHPEAGSGSARVQALQAQEVKLPQVQQRQVQRCRAQAETCPCSG